jgi:hypothetical protein
MKGTLTRGLWSVNSSSTAPEVQLEMLQASHHKECVDKTVQFTCTEEQLELKGILSWGLCQWFTWGFAVSPRLQTGNKRWKLPEDTEKGLQHCEYLHTDLLGIFYKYCTEAFLPHSQNIVEVTKVPIRCAGVRYVLAMHLQYVSWAKLRYSKVVPSTFIIELELCIWCFFQVCPWQTIIETNVPLGR